MSKIEWAIEEIKYNVEYIVEKGEPIDQVNYWTLNDLAIIIMELQRIYFEINQKAG